MWITSDEKVKQYISYVGFNWNVRDSEDVLAFLSIQKQDFVLHGDQKNAKHIWCIEQVINIQDTYIEAFQLMKEGSYYDGWCKLETVEITLNHLARHYVIRGEFGLYWINKAIEQFQKLFPYRIFPGLYPFHVA